MVGVWVVDVLVTQWVSGGTGPYCDGEAVSAGWRLQTERLYGGTGLALELMCETPVSGGAGGGAREGVGEGRGQDATLLLIR